MSREQWGHGYWRGVQDAESGKAHDNFSDDVKKFICHMCISNGAKTYDKSLFAVSELLAICRMAGVSEKYAKKVYDYIMENEPYGCYISGNPHTTWTDDYFVLPCGFNDVNYWTKELERIES